MLYFEDLEGGSTRTSGELELTERDVVDFARVSVSFDSEPRPQDGLVTARLSSIILVARRPAE